MDPRFSFGGDEHLFIEFDEAMSLDAFFKALSLVTALREAAITGVTEICPANASALIRFDPEVIHPLDVRKEVEAILGQMSEASGTIRTRIIEVPVYYDDPWTRETLMKFRDRHQDPQSTDLEYSARVNGFASVDQLIAAHSGTPFFVSMVGFIAGLPFMFQMADRARQIQTPKYLKPRLDTPRQAVVHGGCFSAVHTVRSPGGYQVFGISPLPIFDMEGKVDFLKDINIFFNPGDIVKFAPIGRDDYDRLAEDVAANRLEPRIRPVDFTLATYQADQTLGARKLVETLYAD